MKYKICMKNEVAFIIEIEDYIHFMSEIQKVFNPTAQMNLCVYKDFTINVNDLSAIFPWDNEVKNEET